MSMSCQHHVPVNFIDGKAKADDGYDVHHCGGGVFNKDHFITMVKAVRVNMTSSFNMPVSDRCMFSKSKGEATDSKAKKNGIRHSLNGYCECCHDKCEADKHKYIPPKFKIKTSSSCDHGLLCRCVRAFIITRMAVVTFLLDNRGSDKSRYLLTIQ